MAEDGTEDVMDSWEELEDSGELDKRLQSMKPMEVQNENRNSPTTTKKLEEDSSRTQYQPQVKILKRQTNNTDSVALNNRGPVKPIKTLQQREAEYAEARLRIMGSTANDNAGATNNIATSTTETVPERPARLIQQVEELKVSENVIRQPKGPDGTKGFSKKR